MAKRIRLGVILSAMTTITIGSSARAQVPGQYVGTNSDGFTVELIVYQDSSGKLFLTYAQLAALFYCDGTLLLTRGQEQSYGAATEVSAPVNDGKAKFAGKSNDRSAVTGEVQFHGDAAEGSLTAYSALFSGAKSPPNDAEAKACKTKDLTFKAKVANPLS